MATAEIRTRATLDGKGFEVGIKKMQQSVSSWKNGQLKQIGGMIGGAFAATAVFNFGKEAFAAGAQLEDLADKTGLNTTQVQALSAAAADYGGTQDEVINGLIKLQTLQEEVAAGGGASLKATFTELGISAEEFGSMTTSSLLEIIAKAGPTSAVLKDLFGKTGVKTFGGAIGELGKGGFDQLAKERAAAIMAPEAIKAAGMLEDKIGQIKKSAQSKLLNVATSLTKLSSKDREEAKKKGEQMIKDAEEVAKVEAEARAKRRADFESGIRAEFELKKQEAIDKITVGAPEAADQFARIGGFSGGQMGTRNQAMAIAERQLKELEIIAEIQKDIDKKLGEG